MPLQGDEFEVKQVDEDETRPYAQVIKSLCFGAVVEVVQDGHVEVGLVIDVLDAEPAGKVAEEPSDCDYYHTEEVPR